MTIAELGPGGTIIPPYELARLPRSVFLRSEQLAAGETFGDHEHAWNQLVYATAGSLVVYLERARYVISPEQAIWLPTGTRHASGSLAGASFRSLYVADLPDLAMPDTCAVLAVSRLLRELIVELDALASRAEQPDYQDRLDVLILDVIRRARRQDFALPWPSSPPLRQLCKALYERPGDTRTLVEWGRELALSSRSIMRRFEGETGMTLRDWRQRLRLFRAHEWLASGSGITQVALDLGYASPSAFAFMFRSEMGCSPSEWIRRQTNSGALSERIQQR